MNIQWSIVNAQHIFLIECIHSTFFLISDLYMDMYDLKWLWSACAQHPPVLRPH